MSKRKNLAIITGLIILALVGCTNTAMAKPSRIESGEATTFFITTDIHYLAGDLIHDGDAFQQYLAAGDGKQLNYLDEILEAFIRDIEQKTPDVLIISGDLTNNGEKESHLALARKLGRIEESGTSVYVIPGNHDILNPWALGFNENERYFVESINDKEFNKIYNDFGYTEAVSKDKHSLSYLATPSDDTWLLMLDTNKYKDNKMLGIPQTDGMIKEETFQWIEKCSALAKENGATIITVMHHNLLDHNEVMRSGFTIDNNRDVIERFSEYGLNLVLSGHIHIQDISSYEKVGSSNAPQKFFDIVTSSLAVYPQQYGVLDFSPEMNTFDYSTAFVDVEGWAREEGIYDKNLNEFKRYSYDFFADKAYDMAYTFLEEESTYDDRQKELMARTFEQANVKYFAGTDNVDEGRSTSAGYNLWQEASPSFMKRYILSIYNDVDMEDNSFQMKLESYD